MQPISNSSIVIVLTNKRTLLKTDRHDWKKYHPPCMGDNNSTTLTALGGKNALYRHNGKCIQSKDGHMRPLQILHQCHSQAHTTSIRTYSVSQKIPPPEIFWKIFPNGQEFLVQILHAYYTFLSTLEYKFLFNYLQLWRSYAILSATTIMCSKCPPSTETHAERSHLIWHNNVKVADNWIKIRTLA